MNLLHVPIEIAVILVVTTSFGWLLRQAGQPTVVGEITGGLLLGPLVFGQLSPRWSAALFPSSSFPQLDLISRVGLVLFLFIIGAELDVAAIRRKAGSIAAITTGSVLLPFAMGAAIAPLLWRRFAAQSSFAAFVLFIGIAMSITALPVLASLLREREASGRPVPAESTAIALLSAAANDALGWCVLAAILALLHSASGWARVSLNIALLLVLVAAMLLLLRPLLPKVLAGMPRWLAAALLVLLAFATSSATDSLGVHTFFGAFLAGLCVPRGEPTHSLYKWWQPVIRITLPVFFALTGLRMQPGLFRSDGTIWLFLVVAVAVVGKVVGAAGGARLNGMPWHQAGLIGVLLNTRGLVGLIVLNVGYKEGVLNSSLFTLFVLMALLTTSMTAPLLKLLIDSPRS